MNPTSHRAVAIAAVECLADLEPRNGSTKNRLMISGQDFALPSNKAILAAADANTDGKSPKCDGKTYSNYDFSNEVRFIDINGQGDGKNNALDDPHHNEFWEVCDKCEKEGLGSSFAAYNHFIDIGKGKGTYDDYDGYSYHNGSGHLGEYEDVFDAVPYFTNDFWPNAGNIVAAAITKNMKTDEALAWYFGDSNVEYPGSKWYCNCSPSLWNYSYPSQEMDSKYDELEKRFPWGGYGSNSKNKGKCVPWSVFMPVDNLGRYWYETFLMSRKVWDLGPVLHAVQDACVPHHAAGHMGNYHAKYEKWLEKRLHDKTGGNTSWSNLESLRTQAKELYQSFNHILDKPKSLTYPQDLMNEKPNLSWSVDQIITWAAFNAYYEYVYTYNGFKSLKNIAEFRTETVKKLFVLSLALSMLILRKAQIEAIPVPRERKVEAINLEPINMSGKGAHHFMICITQGSMNGMVGGSIETGVFRDKWGHVPHNYYFVDVSEYAIDAAYMLLSIKKEYSDTLTVKNLKVTYKTKDGVWHDYYNERNPEDIVLDSKFQKTIPRTIQKKDNFPIALGADYPYELKDRIYIDKVRVCLQPGEDKDAGSSGGLTLRVNCKYSRTDYDLFPGGMAHGKETHDVAFLLFGKAKPRDLVSMELINKRDNAVHIVGFRTQFLDGYSNVLLPGPEHTGDFWLDPGREESLVIAQSNDFQPLNQFTRVADPVVDPVTVPGTDPVVTKPDTRS